ncbi:putative signal peptide protein [Puccinia sorghi]|uniref:Putative signal peptide protein n=1 Tax=Puccinia sorghi TaxID=27349 RepID=A0A0L6VJK7_9BASI|nr:putative signal peptide protein [Puccinia sorghi]
MYITHHINLSFLMPALLLRPLKGRMKENLTLFNNMFWVGLICVEQKEESKKREFKSKFNQDNYGTHSTGNKRIQKGESRGKSIFYIIKNKVRKCLEKYLSTQSKGLKMQCGLMGFYSRELVEIKWTRYIMIHLWVARVVKLNKLESIFGQVQGRKTRRAEQVKSQHIFYMPLSKMEMMNPHPLETDRKILTYIRTHYIPEVQTPEHFITDKDLSPHYSLFSVTSSSWNLPVVSSIFAMGSDVNAANGCVLFVNYFWLPPITRIMCDRWQMGSYIWLCYSSLLLNCPQGAKFGFSSCGVALRVCCSYTSLHLNTWESFTPHWKGMVNFNTPSKSNSTMYKSIDCASINQATLKFHISCCGSLSSNSLHKLPHAQESASFRPMLGLRC